MKPEIRERLEDFAKTIEESKNLDANHFFLAVKNSYWDNALKSKPFEDSINYYINIETFRFFEMIMLTYDLSCDEQWPPEEVLKDCRRIMLAELEHLNKILG